MLKSELWKELKPKWPKRSACCGRQIHVSFLYQVGIFNSFISSPLSLSLIPCLIFSPLPPPPPLFLSSLFHIASYWDDWMREPQQRKGRVCIRPEISRTYTFGDAGVSLGQYWSQHLQYIVLNQNPVDFSKVNISYLQQVSCSEGFLVMI